MPQPRASAETAMQTALTQGCKAGDDNGSNCYSCSKADNSSNSNVHADSSSSSNSSTDDIRPWSDGVPTAPLEAILAHLPQQQRLLAAAVVCKTWAAAAAAATTEATACYDVVTVMGPRPDVHLVFSWLEKHGRNVKSLAVSTTPGRDYQPTSIYIICPPFHLLPQLRSFKMTGWLTLKESSMPSLVEACRTQVTELELSSLMSDTLDILLELAHASQQLASNPGTGGLVLTRPETCCTTNGGRHNLCLQSLRIGNCGFEMGQPDFIFPAFHQYLTSLTLTKCSFGYPKSYHQACSKSTGPLIESSPGATQDDTPKYVDILLGMAGLTALRKLSMFDVRRPNFVQEVYDRPIVADLAALSKMRSLTCLEFVGCYDVDIVHSDSTVGNTLGMLPNLQRLSLDTVGHVKCVRIFKHLTALTYLKLKQRKVMTTHDMAVLFGGLSLLRSLKTFNHHCASTMFK